MAKYTADDLKAMGAKGHAFRNPDGHYSFPIGDEEDLHNAIHAVGRGGASHDAIRAYIIRRAKALGLSAAIPDTWQASGSNSTSADRAAFELRKRRRASMIRQSERRGLLLEVRAKPDGTGGTEFVFEGYGSVFDSPFDMWDRWGEPYTEVVKPGAFTRSLGRPDLDVPFLIGHDESRLALARTKNGTLQLSQDSHGLNVRATMDGRRSDVRDLAYAVERGDQDEMSIGFVTMGQEWSEDYETRSMLDLDIHRGDVSSVALAALPATAGASMTFPAETLSRSRRAAEPLDPDQAPPEERAADHGPFTGSHTHGHPAYGDGDGDHHHQDDALHDHPHPAMLTTTSAHAPREHRGNPVDQDLGDAPDYNPDGGVPHTERVTCGGMNPAAAKYCSWCGDALVRIDSDGVPGMTEEQGSAASLAALRRREFELLALVR